LHAGEKKEEKDLLFRSKRKIKIKFETLKRKSDFSRVIKEGSCKRDKYLTLYIFKKAETFGLVRIGLGVSKKIGGAVIRNKIKRVLKEALRKVEIKSYNDFDILILVKPDIVTASFLEIKNKLEYSLNSFLTGQL
jgi:ribonuclease P protein component